MPVASYPVMTTKNASRPARCSLGGKITPQLRTALVPQKQGVQDRLFANWKLKSK
uniref:Alternative protein FKBP5 n=1 Tax=Homo sapiens TaxID=9606 RepID=L8EC85_HUMAN|nr:alternative protein FKBP5 [Homo sapiens]